jgi:hypothetical protein
MSRGLSISALVCADSYPNFDCRYHARIEELSAEDQERRILCIPANLETANLETLGRDPGVIVKHWSRWFAVVAFANSTMTRDSVICVNVDGNPSVTSIGGATNRILFELVRPAEAK